MLNALYGFFASPLTYAWLLTALCVLVIAWDMKAYLIPNWINAVILLAFIPAAYFMKIYAIQPLIAFAIMLGLGLLIYAAGFMGGGDVKLIAALTLWTGLHEASVTFLVYTAILGGVLVVFLWISRRIIRIFWKRNLPLLLSTGAPVPYGVAIALAFTIMLWQGRVPVLPV